MTSSTEIKRHLEQALGADALAAVAAVRHLAGDDLRWLEERVVRLARADGFTWAQIGRLRGKSRQAVRRRFGPIDGTPQPLPAPVVRHDVQIVSRWRESVADRRRRAEFESFGAHDAVSW